MTPSGSVDGPTRAGGAKRAVRRRARSSPPIVRMIGGDPLAFAGPAAVAGLDVAGTLARMGQRAAPSPPGPPGLA